MEMANPSALHTEELNQSDAAGTSPLSPREREITRLVAKGLPNKTIAAILDISPWTVATHLRRIFAKLGIHSRTAMISALLEAGQLGQPG